MKGFSFRNLKYMRQFATVYPNLLIGQQPVAQLIKKQVKLITQQPAALIKKDKNLIGQQPVAQLQKSKKNLIVQQPAAQFNNKTYYLSNPFAGKHSMGAAYIIDRENKR